MIICAVYRPERCLLCYHVAFDPITGIAVSIADTPHVTFVIYNIIYVVLLVLLISYC